MLRLFSWAIWISNDFIPQAHALDFRMQYFMVQSIITKLKLVNERGLWIYYFKALWDRLLFCAYTNQLIRNMQQGDCRFEIYHEVYKLKIHLLIKMYFDYSLGKVWMSTDLSQGIP